MDPYRKHQFVHGHTITPEEMQDIDNGIDAVNKEATRLELAKVDKVEGMDLSKNNYSDEDKQKVQNAATTENVSKLENEVERHAFGEQSGSRNLWDEKWEVGNIDGSGGEGTLSTCIRSVGFTSVNASKQYYLVANSAYTTFVHYYDSNKAWLSRESKNGSVSFSIPSNCKYIRISTGSEYGGTYRNDIAIIEGTSGTYEPYIASNAMLTESANASEVAEAELMALGWCVPDEMPVKNSLVDGVLTQYVDRNDLGTLRWIRNKYGDNYLFGAALPKSKHSSSNTSLPCFLTQYVVTSESYTEMKNGECGIYGYSSTYGGIFIRDDAFTDIDSFVNHINGYVYYELAAQITHNITDMPSQKSMISDAWDDDPSNKVYYVGDLRIDGNRLHECYVQTDRTSGKPSVDTAHWRKTSVDEVIRKVNATVSADSEIINMTRVAYGFDADSIDRSGKYYFRDRVDEYQHLPSDQHNFILESIYADSNRKAQIGFSVNTGKMWYRVASSGGVYNRAWKEL